MVVSKGNAAIGDENKKKAGLLNEKVISLFCFVTNPNSFNQKFYKGLIQIRYSLLDFHGFDQKSFLHFLQKK